MKAVLMSIRPQWCELIASGKKTVEIRKNRPKLETPFKVYIYCTKDFKPNVKYGFKLWAGRGKIIGEFVCDEIKRGVLTVSEYVDSVNIGSKETCLTVEEIKAYLGMEYVDVKGQHDFYGWRISDIVIYDKPKILSQFVMANTQHYCHLQRPPQSWCYVEESEDGQ